MVVVVVVVVLAVCVCVCVLLRVVRVCIYNMSDIICYSFIHNICAIMYHRSSTAHVWVLGCLGLEGASELLERLRVALQTLILPAHLIAAFVRCPCSGMHVGK